MPGVPWREKSLKPAEIVAQKTDQGGVYGEERTGKGVDHKKPQGKKKAQAARY